MGGPWNGRGGGKGPPIVMGIHPESQAGLKARFDNLQAQFSELLEWKRHSIIAIAGLVRGVGEVVDQGEVAEGDTPPPELKRLVVPAETMKGIDGDERVFMNLNGETSILTVTVRDQTEAEKAAQLERLRGSAIARPNLVLPPGAKLS